MSNQTVTYPRSTEVVYTTTRIDPRQRALILAARDFLRMLAAGIRILADALEAYITE